VLTTRAAAQAFFDVGTNRRMFRFTMINHMCTDLTTVMDTTRPTDRIRQDVSRRMSAPITGATAGESTVID